MWATQQTAPSFSSGDFMLRQRAIIITDAFAASAPSQPGDWHRLARHHRYPGNPACNSAERIAETSSGQRSPSHRNSAS
jgi:hypothetical protein